VAILPLQTLFIIAEMDRWLAKLIGLILTFLLPFIFTVIPHHMIGCIERQGDRGKRILSLLMCFGGGIFLATYLLHMGPEVRQADKPFYVPFFNRTLLRSVFGDCGN